MARLTKREKQFEELDDKYFDLPDGAYFAAMEEAGFYPEEMIELSESITKKRTK